MVEPQKIRVVLFDDSIDSQENFMAHCGGRSIVDVVCAFHSFFSVASLLERDGFHFLHLLAPDVVVLHLEKAEPEELAQLLDFRKNCRAKWVGLLSRDCIRDHTLLRLFDYYTAVSGTDYLQSDEDIYTHLLYQIKTARLALKTEQAGIKGKWAILPIPSKPIAVRKIKLIAIGASAGGTEAVSRLLSALPGNFPPILVVQHIPENFTEFFSGNLAGKVSMKVTVARGGERLEDGNVYIAGNDQHLLVIQGEDGRLYTKCTHGEKVSGHRPSVDVLFRSAAKAAGSSALGIILTGMGSDGAQGLLEMREAGAFTIGQDKDSCAVYGMPMVAYSIGAVARQLPLEQIADELKLAVSGKNKMETNDE